VRSSIANGSATAIDTGPAFPEAKELEIWPPLAIDIVPAVTIEEPASPDPRVLTEMVPLSAILNDSVVTTDPALPEL
jgi:hypothetical protein